MNLIRKAFRYYKKNGLWCTLIHVKAYLRYRPDRLRRDFYARYGRRPPVMPFHFETHLADHCNLDCWGCTHFSPLSEKCFAELEIFTKDFKRLSELFGKKVGWISLMGGEPLLHPELEKFFPVARTALPSARIRIVTNGILLSKKEDSFWRECSAQNIEISVTVYPNMEKQFEAARGKGRSFDVQVYSFNNLEIPKTSFHHPLDLSGKQSPSLNFVKCPIAECITLRNGRLYPCSVRAYLYIFNKYFPEHALPESEKDSIDIYAAKSAAEILDFLSRPIPFCRFCHVDKISDTASWRHSKKDIKEWS